MIDGPVPTCSKGRIGQAKSKNGCLTCKIRRVKCSEEKPECRRCTSTGRKCDYKAATGHDFKSWSRNPTPQWRNLSGSQSPPLVVALDSHPVGLLGDCSVELRAFEYFFMRGLPIFPRAIDNRFWKTCILQACHAEPVIWDAVISLSALFEHPQYSKEPVRGLRGAPRKSPGTPAKDPAHQQALVWYSRSLSKLRKGLANGMVNDTIVLISCILYICIELLQDNVTEVLQLYHHGAGIMSKYIRNTNASLIDECFTPLFYNFSALATCMDYIPPGMVVVRNLQISDHFSSLEEAEMGLYRFLSRGITHARASEQVLLFEKNVPKERMAELQAEKEFLWDELDKWYQRFRAMGFTLESSNITPAEKYLTVKLLQAHATFRVSIATSMVISEMANDDLTAEFEDMLRYGRFGIEAIRYPDGTQPPFSLETSMALPLFVCATKCRDYRIRHEALDLLQQAPPVQGLCNATTHAVMAAKVVGLEEAGLDDESMFIPEERRISHFFITSKKSETGADMWVLQYTRNIPGQDGYRIVTDLSPF
ncbi:Transcriptional activator protein UGA3 [Talaromyces islandicus]|uniref:Transcriptional activator protein UGA3 n=1 Tax=Talaromyces islandicus TaxID=28573 RepID=A0A0U1M2G3_TALIS|nr:Transcriptional activator protein UGA3 [Talaromyces islandicus]